MHVYEILAASAPADTTRFASNVTGATWSLTETTTGDDLAHKVVITNDSSTDHTGKTITLTGAGPNGEAQTETIAGPDASTTSTSAKYYLTLTSVTVSATIGADTFDIGMAADSVTPWHTVHYHTNVDALNLGFGCTVVTGTPTYTVQHSYGDGTAFNHASVAAETTSQDGSYTTPVRALRLAFAAAGTVRLTGLQVGV